MVNGSKLVEPFVGRVRDTGGIGMLCHDAAAVLEKLWGEGIQGRGVAVSLSVSVCTSLESSLVLPSMVGLAAVQ